jgi:hypothetical protein
MAAKARDWTLALQLAEPAIRYLHWGGDRPQLAAMFNLAGRAMAHTADACAAVLQGAARRLAATAQPPPTPAGSDPTDVQPHRAAAVAASFTTELWRETAGLLSQSLGETRLAELRAQGEAMDEDHAVAYAFDMIAKVLRMSTTT